MRACYNNDGYIWIKNLAPRRRFRHARTVFVIRRALTAHAANKNLYNYFSQLAPTGILLHGTSPRDGIFDFSKDPFLHQGLGASPEAQSLEILDIAHTTPTNRQFLEHPALRMFTREFMGWKQEVLVKRAMLRHNCPGSLSTGIHYDQYFLRGGEAEFLTAWVPVGDCAANGSGLMYLENSNNLGEDIEAEFLLKTESLSLEEQTDAFNRYMAKDGFLSHDAEEFGRVMGRGRLSWLVGDYEAGDVVFHKPHMIHGATKNEGDLEG